MKKTLFLIFLFFIALPLNSSVFNAEGGSVTIQDGAAIRIGSETTKQGLRFYANVDTLKTIEERGFYLVYGEATLTQLQSAIEASVEGVITLNDKKVFKEIIADHNPDTGEFSIVLTDIPIEGYKDNITAFAYATVGGIEEIVPVGTTRSVINVALNGANKGDATLQPVLTTIEANYFKVKWDEFGNYVIDTSLYEYDRVNLRSEFIKDWNNFAGTTWTDLVAKTFFDSAKVGLTDAIGSNKNLSESNIYKFFNDPVYETKWGWLLNFIKSNDGTTHPSRQVEAIQGDGTNGDFDLYHSDQLSYSIANFFNKEYKVGGYTAINFTTPVGLAKYNNIPTYNKKVYANYNSYEFINLNDTITIPNPPIKEHYTFTSYTGGILPGSSYKVSSATKLTPQYTADQYSITYFDGETSLSDLNSTYTVESNILLPDYVKEGYTFEGWYDNSGFSGSPITSIPTGSFGNKVFYAKTTVSSFESVEVTYNLNGGQLNSTDLYQLRTSDTYIKATRYSTAGDSAGADITVGTSRGGQYWYVMGLKPTGIPGIYEIIGKGTGYTNSEATLYISYHDGCKSEYKKALADEYNSSTIVGSYVVIEWLPPAVTATTSIDMYFIAASEATANVVQTLQDPSPMLVPVRVGYTFDGWCMNSDLSDTPINEYPGYLVSDPITYYAKWTATP